MSPKPFHVYKDSGVPWCPMIPESWSVSTVKRIAKFTTGWTPPSGNSDFYGEEYFWANISDIGPKVLNETSKGISQLAIDTFNLESSKPGDLLFSFKLSIGQVSLVGREMYTNEAIATFKKVDGYDIRWAFYAFPNFIPENSEKNIYGAPLLNQERIKNAKIFFPPLSEQQNIASFLDREILKIDELIKKQEMLINLLIEKRQSQISNLIFCNHVEKTSSKLKFLIKTRKGIAFKAADFTDEGVSVVKASDIKRLTLLSGKSFLPNKFLDLYPQAILKTDEILISTVGSNPTVTNSAVGQIAKVPMQSNGSLLNQNTVVFSPDDTVLTNDYLFYFIQTKAYRDHLDLHAHGTANQSSLSIDDILNFDIEIPPINIQKTIVKTITVSTEKIDNLMAKSYESIALIKEHRFSIISAAVTGKIDVRELAQ